MKVPHLTQSSNHRRGVGGVLALLLLPVLAPVGPAMAYKLTREESKKYDVEGQTRIYVKNTRGKTIIVGRDGVSAVAVRAVKVVRAPDSDEAQERMDGLTFRVDVDGDEISIVANHPQSDGGRNSFWAMLRGLRYKNEISFTIEVPNRFAAKVSSRSGDVQIASLEGDVKVFGSSGDVFLKRIGSVFVQMSSGDLEVLDAHGAVHAQSSSGDAVFRDITQSLTVRATSGDVEIHSVGGDTDVELSSGDLFLRGCRGDVWVSTSSGDCVIEEVDGSVKASANSGDLEVHIVPVGERRFNFVTSSGDVRVVFSAPPSYGFFLEVNTSSGSIEGDLDIRLDKISRRLLKGVVGSGESQVWVETASGNIRIIEAGN